MRYGGIDYQEGSDALEERTLTTHVVPLNYVVGPANGPPMILLHGGTLDWHSFSPIIPLLVERWQVIAPDLRGHGKSGRAPGTYRVIDYADDIMALLEITQGEPAVLLGHSLSALAAIEVAARSRERVRALILEDVPLFYRRTRLVDSPWFGWFNAVYESVTEATSRAEIEAGLQRRVPSMSPRAVARAAEPLVQLDPDVVAALLEHRHMEGFDTDEQLRRVQSPVLLLQADRARGPALTDEDAAYALDMLHDARLVQVEGASHAIHVSQPQAVAKHTERFLGVTAQY